MISLLRFSFLSFFFLGCSVTLALPTTQPGQIIKIPLNKDEYPARPQVFFNDEKVMLTNDDSTNAWIIWLGIALNTKPGKYQLKMKSAQEEKFYSFRVTHQSYPEQRLNIPEKKYVTPPKYDLARIGKEKKEMTGFFRSFTQKEPNVTFMLPVDGRLSSKFGLRRVLNGKPRNPHSGIDIAAPEGTPIKAAASGIVVGAGAYYFNGNSVFIEHGQGLVTMYCHLKDILVKKGDRVKQGNIIGTVGRTGRVTGAHLHWGVSLNNARVDPKYFTQDLR